MPTERARAFTVVNMALCLLDSLLHAGRHMPWVCTEEEEEKEN